MNPRDVLERLAGGEMTVAEAEAALALTSIAAVDEFARLDLGRHGRKGVPEIVMARGKSPGHLRKIVIEMLEHTGRAIISGLDAADVSWKKLAAEAREGVEASGSEAAGMLVLRRSDFDRRVNGGKVGVMTAGTADVPAADQARIVAEEMGCEVVTAYDVGIAGVHRLAAPLKEMLAAGVASMVVAAGMEGALPSVVAGLVPVPVIGLPTSTGYGLGGGGVTALLAMLQSCCPGLVVVNIDNGVGAGATAALIANRAV